MSRRIDDHSFWAGSKSKDSVFPKGAHHKHEKSASGAGALDEGYPDTSEEILRDQNEGVKHIKNHKMKTGYRY